MRAPSMQRRAAGEALGPLAGVPVVIKEAMDFVGLPSTGGWAPLSSLAGGFDLMPGRRCAGGGAAQGGGRGDLGQDQYPGLQP